MKNKYIQRSHISEKKFREVIKYFSYEYDLIDNTLLKKHIFLRPKCPIHIHPGREYIGIS